MDTTGMMLIIVFKEAAKALRNPEKYPQALREHMAQSLELVSKGGEDVMLTEFMNEQLKKEPDKPRPDR